jgi:hypothetical protein
MIAWQPSFSLVRGPFYNQLTAPASPQGWIKVEKTSSPRPTRLRQATARRQVVVPDEAHRHASGPYPEAKPRSPSPAALSTVPRRQSAAVARRPDARAGGSGGPAD